MNRAADKEQGLYSSPFPSIFERHRETAMDFLWRALQIVGKQGLTFLAFLIAANLLPPYDFGVYNYLMAVVLLLVTFGDFGISTATSKFVAEYAATDPERVRRVLANATGMLLACTGAVALALAAAGRWFLGVDYLRALHFMPLLFLIPMTSLYDGLYRGLGRFRILALISVLTGLLSIPCVAILIWRFGFLGAVHAQNLFYLALLLMLSLGYREAHWRFDGALARSILSYSVAIGLANIGYFLYTRVDVFFLRYFGCVVEIGYYEIAMRMLQLLMLPCAILGQVIAPRVTALHATGEFRRVRLQAEKGSAAILPSSILLGLGAYAVARIGLSYFIPKYDVPLMTQTLLLLVILLPLKNWGVFVTQGYVVPGGYARALTVVTLAGGVANIVLDYILIRRLGYIGVIWATLIVHGVSIVGVNAWFWVLIRRAERESRTQARVPWIRGGESARKHRFENGANTSRQNLGNDTSAPSYPCHPPGIMRRVRKSLEHRYIRAHYYAYAWPLRERLRRILGCDERAVGLDAETQEERALPGFTRYRATGYYRLMLARYLFARQYARGKRVLEIGAGLGWGAHLISDVCRTLLCVDRDADAAAFAISTWEDAKIDYRVLDVAELDRLLVGPIGKSEPPTASFDVVLAFELIEHLDLAEAARLLATVRMLLAPHGLLMLSSYIPDTPEEAECNCRENVYHKHVFCKMELKRLLHEQGFARVRFLGDVLVLARTFDEQ